MTLILAALTSTGIVLTADSRQTYRNKAGAVRIGSDTVIKLFKLTARSGVSISGRAFINEDGKPVREVGYFIKQFGKTPGLDAVTVREQAEMLGAFIGEIFVPREMAALRKQIEDDAVRRKWTDLKFSPAKGIVLPHTYLDADGKAVSWNSWIETVTMIVAGIDRDGVGRAYTVQAGTGIQNEGDTIKAGAMWQGQTDVLKRLIKGYAPEINDLDVIKNALAANHQDVIAQLNQIEYIINWGTLTLQDAVDFCVLLTKTTEAIQRFSDGTPVSPGGIPGVGGLVDVAVITPETGFVWVQKKKIQADIDSVDIEAG